MAPNPKGELKVSLPKETAEEKSQSEQNVEESETEEGLAPPGPEVVQSSPLPEQAERDLGSLLSESMRAQKKLSVEAHFRSAGEAHEEPGVPERVEGMKRASEVEENLAAASKEKSERRWNLPLETTTTTSSSNPQGDHLSEGDHHGDSLMRRVAAPPPEDVEEEVSRRMGRQPEPEEPTAASCSKGQSAPLDSKWVVEIVDEAVQVENPSEGARKVLDAVCPGGSSLGGDEGSLVAQLLLARMGGAAIEAAEGEMESGQTADVVEAIISPLAAKLGLAMLPSLPQSHPWGEHLSPQGRLAGGVKQAALSSSRNRALLSAYGLHDDLAQVIAGNRESVTELVLRFLQEALSAMLAHSAPLRSVRTMLYLSATNGAHPNVLRSIRDAVALPEAGGPPDSFYLDGNGTGILGPCSSKWPFGNGLAFACWLYVETFAESEASVDASQNTSRMVLAQGHKSSPDAAAAAAAAAAGETEAYLPRLFSFLTADGMGVEAMFHGPCLVIEAAGQKSRHEVVAFTQAILPRQWHFVTVELSHSFARLHINGDLVESHAFSLPSLARPLAFSCVATNPPAAMAGLQRKRRQCALAGELGPVFVFTEPIGPRFVNALFHLPHGDMCRLLLSSTGSRGGTSASALFSSTITAPLRSDVTSLQNFLEAKCLHIFHPTPSFPPQASPRASIPDLSPYRSKAVLRAMKQRHGDAEQSNMASAASPLGGLSVTRRTKLVATLWAIGQSGPCGLLPNAMGAIDGASLEPAPACSSDSRADNIVSLSHAIGAIAALCAKHSASARRFERAPLVDSIAHLLFSVPWRQIRKKRAEVPDTNVTRAEIDLVRSLSRLESELGDSKPRHALWRRVLFEHQAWRWAQPETLLELAKALRGIAADPFRQAALHEEGALQGVLDLLRFSGPRLAPEKRREFSEAMHLCCSVLARPYDKDDVRAIVSASAEMHDPILITPLMVVLRSFLLLPNSHQRSSATAAFLACSGTSSAMAVLRSNGLRRDGDNDHQIEDNDRATAEAVRLLAQLLSSGSLEQKVRETVVHLVQTVFEERGRTCGDMDLQKELLQASLSEQLGGLDSSLIDGSAVVEDAELLGVFLRSLPFAPGTVQREGLQNLLLLVCTGAKNREALLSASGWSEAVSRVWLGSSVADTATQHNDSRSVEEMARNLFTVVCQHALRSEGGWMNVESCFQVLLDSAGRQDKLPVGILLCLRLLADVLRFVCEELQGSVSAPSLLIHTGTEGFPSGSSEAGPEQSVKKSQEVSDSSHFPSTPEALRNNAMCLLAEAEGLLRTSCKFAFWEASFIESNSVGTAHAFGGFAEGSAPEVDVDTSILAEPARGIIAWLDRREEIGDQRANDLCKASLEALRAGGDLAGILLRLEDASNMAADEHLLIVRILLSLTREEHAVEDTLYEDSAEEDVTSSTRQKRLSEIACEESGMDVGEAYKARSQAALRSSLLPLLASTGEVRLAARALAAGWVLFWDCTYMDSALECERQMAPLLAALLKHWSERLKGVFDRCSDEGNPLIEMEASPGPEDFTKDSRWSHCMDRKWVNEHLMMMIGHDELALKERGKEGSSERHSRILQGEGHALATTAQWRAWLLSDDNWHESSFHHALHILVHNEQARLEEANVAGKAARWRAAEAWRGLLRSLVEQDALTAMLVGETRPRWKVDFTETASRERKRLIRDFESSPHDGCALDDATGSSYPNGQQQSDVPSVKPPVGGEKTKAREEEEEDEFCEGAAFDEEEDLAAEGVEPPSGSNSQGMQYHYQQHHQQHAGSHHSKKLFEGRCELVKPLGKASGCLRITTEEIVFEPEGPEGEEGRELALEAIAQVHGRRYLLLKTALEIFLTRRTSLFLNFQTKKERIQAAKAIEAAKPPNLSLEGRKNPSEAAQKSAERWARREMSNFDYLMHLNALAGRSFNDVTQYPVFPWVLQDYTSDELDLSNPAVFRDLSKPVGALNPERLRKFLERYRSFDDPEVPKFMYGSHYSSAGIVLHYLLRLEPFTSLGIELQGGNFDHPDRVFRSVVGTFESALRDMSDVKELVPEWYCMPEMFQNRNRENFGRTQAGVQVGDVELPPWADGPHDFVRKMRDALESDVVSDTLHQWIDLIFGYKQRGQAAADANNVFYYLTYEGYVDLDAITDPLLLKATQDQIAFFGQTPSQLFRHPHPKRQPCRDPLLPIHRVLPSALQGYALPINDRSLVKGNWLFTSSDGILVVSQFLYTASHRLAFNRPDGKGKPFTYYGTRRSHGGGHSSSLPGLLSTLTSSSQSSTERVPLRMQPVPPGHPDNEPLSSCAADPSGSVLFVAGTADGLVSAFSVPSLMCLSVSAPSSVDSPATCVACCPSTGRLVAAGTVSGTILLFALPRGFMGSNERHAQSSSGIASSSGQYNVHGGGSSSSHSVDSLQQSSPLPAGAVPVELFVDAVAQSPFRKSWSTQQPAQGESALERPVHALHGRSEAPESLALSLELDLVASISRREGLMLHSCYKGSAVRRIPELRGTRVHISPEGYIVALDAARKRLRCASMNGDILSDVAINAEDGLVSAMQASSDGRALLVGHKWLAQKGPALRVRSLPLLEETQRVELPGWAEISALGLTPDNTNLAVCTLEGHVFVLTDPTVSLNLLNHLVRLGGSWIEQP